MPNPSLVRRHKGIVRHTLHQTLHIDAVRYVVARARYEWYTRVRKSMKTLDLGDGVASNTVSHNLKGLRDLAVARSLYLLRPLSVLDAIAPDADVLLIGPRTEGEILATLAHGFDKSHITAVDLISYSPWVELGDMHALPYADDSFDVVIAGWVLAYSDDKAKAVSEILRVTRPGATVAIGVEWNSRSIAEVEETIGYVPGADVRISSTDEIVDLFGAGVDRVLAEQSPPTDAIGAHSLVVVFRVAGA